MIRWLQTKPMLQKLGEFRAYVAMVLAGYLGVIVARLSGSSMGLLSDTGEGLVLGVNRPIRSDEYLRGTPTDIGSIYHPDSPGVSLLSAEGFDEPGLDEFELLRPERFFIHTLLVGDFGFAAMWWVPALFVLLGIPLLLKQFKLPLNISIALCLIILFSPSVVWWSNGIAGIIGRLSLGVAFIIMASNSKGWKVWALTFLGGWIASGVAMDYQPWSIVASIFFAPLVFFFVFQKRRNILPMLASGILSLAPLLYFVHSNFGVFQVLSSTLYPGQRRVSSGLVNAWGWSLAGPQQWSLINPDGIIYSNQSEISMGYFLFVFPAIYFAYASINRSQRFGLREVILGSYLIVTSWAFVTYPEIPLNPLALVSPERALAVVTTLAPLVFGLIYANRVTEQTKYPSNGFVFDKRSDTWSRIALGVFVFLATFGAAETMDGVVLNFQTRIAFLVAILCGAIVVMITHPKFTSKGVWAFALLAALIAGPVNPIAQGTAPLTDNSLARAIASIETSGVWATDSIHLDAILVANGKPSISGQQLTGPNESQWRLLDPQGLAEGIWNAGASFVVIAWDSGIQTPVISRPFGDTILISSNPCAQEFQNLKLKVVLSRTEQTSECLVKSPAGPVDYMGAPVFIYEMRK